MRTRWVLASSLGSLGLALLVSEYYDLSLERAALLAPVIVLSFAAVAGLVLLWGRIALESLRPGRRRRPG